MDVRQLTYFVHAAQFGSISRAAAYLKVAQPAISRQLSQLEVDLGTTLFVRHGRGITLTEAGKSVLVHAQAMLAEAGQMRQDVLGLSRQPEGEVKLGIPAMVAPLLVPRLLHRLKQSYPHIRLNVMQELSEDVRMALVCRTVDVGIFHSNRPIVGLVYEKLREDELYLIGRSDGPLRGHSEVELAQLGKFPLVLPPATHELRQLVETAARQLGVSLNVTFELDTVAVIKRIIQMEDLHTIFPLVAAWPEMEHDQLRYARICNPSLIRPLLLATMPTGVSVAARVVAHCARQEFLDGMQGIRRQGTG